MWVLLLVIAAGVGYWWWTGREKEPSIEEVKKEAIGVDLVEAPAVTEAKAQVEAPMVAPSPAVMEVKKEVVIAEAKAVTTPTEVGEKKEELEEAIKDIPVEEQIKAREQFYVAMPVGVDPSGDAVKAREAQIAAGEPTVYSIDWWIRTADYAKGNNISIEEAFYKRSGKTMTPALKQELQRYGISTGAPTPTPVITPVSTTPLAPVPPPVVVPPPPTFGTAEFQAWMEEHYG